MEKIDYVLTCQGCKPGTELFARNRMSGIKKSNQLKRWRQGRNRRSACKKLWIIRCSKDCANDFFKFLRILGWGFLRKNTAWTCSGSTALFMEFKLGWTAYDSEWIETWSSCTGTNFFGKSHYAGIRTHCDCVCRGPVRQFCSAARRRKSTSSRRGVRSVRRKAGDSAQRFRPHLIFQGGRRPLCRRSGCSRVHNERGDESFRRQHDTLSGSCLYRRDCFSWDSIAGGCRDAGRFKSFTHRDFSVLRGSRRL